jgi:CheY-like chemotaxis protein
MMQPRAATKQLALRYHLPAEAPRFLKGDPSRLRQVLFNLVGNALKFTDRGQVEILLSTAQQADGRHQLTVSVKDSGIGIPAHKQAELFTRFTQADRSIARRYGGTGLGLAICKQLIELMGGEIGVESREFEGSRFWFSVALPEGQALAESGFADNQKGAATQRALRILVAEDNQVNQVVIGMLLRRLGHEVDMANNGLEACEAVQRLPYDLVLMDVQMPEMDGLAATRAIRRLSHDCNMIPIIALTANAMSGDREIYLDAGMNDYVSKPIELPQLIAAMNRALGGTEAASAANGSAPEIASAPSPNPGAPSPEAQRGLAKLLASLQKLH